MAPRKRKNWTEYEVCQALALYFVTSFGRMHSRNPDVIELAKKLDRSSGSVAMKLGNLAALDDSIPQKGFANASGMDRKVWEKSLIDPQELIDAFGQIFEISDQKKLGNYEIKIDRSNLTSGLEEVQSIYKAEVTTEKRVEATRRIGQEFFRRSILISYEGKCALTGIEDPRLLNASHIVAWKDDPANRVNPSNGICLNALHDRAFDRHLITFDEDYRMVVSNHVPEIARQELLRIDARRIELPRRFLPDQKFLELHRRKFRELTI